MRDYDAIVLAGGAGRRMGMVDKLTLEVGGHSLLDRVLGAVSAAGRVVAVGPPRPSVTTRPVVWCREDPPGAGPRAALEAALPLTSAPVVLVVAGDLPAIASAIPVLLDRVAEQGTQVSVLVDPDGQVNYVAAAWQRDQLESALGRPGRTLRELFAGKDVCLIDDTHGWGADCDTPEDLERARRRDKGLRPEAQH